MRASVLLERIRAECPAFAHVDHALAAPAKYGVPAAFVAVAKIAADPSKGLNAHAQVTRWMVRVFVMLHRGDDATTAYNAADTLDDCLDQLRAALKGWQPEGADTPLDFAGGELAERDRLACWAEDYATTILLRS